MKKHCIIFLILIAYSVTFGQSTVLLPNINETPRLNYSQIVALPSPKVGSMVFDTNSNCLRIYNGLEWLCTFENSAQTAWKITGGSSKSIVHSVSDAVGNLYVLGNFGGTVDFGGISLTSSSSADIFVLKYSKNNQLIWANRIGNTNGGFAGKIAVSENGDVYVSGEYTGTLSLGTFILNPIGFQDIFIIKYNSNGSVLWAKNAGGSDSDWGGEGLVADHTGVYLTGGFSGTATFGSTILTSAGSFDMFLTKLDQNGVFLWAIKGGSSASDRGISLAKDELGNIYVGGIYHANASFGSFLVTNSGNSDGFIAKYSSNGTVLWVNRISGSIYDWINQIAIDNSGNVYAAGVIQSNTTFYSNTNNVTLNAMEAGGQFIAKYNTNGNLIWAKQPFISSTSDLIQSLSIDKNNNIYTTGAFAGSFVFRGETYNGGATSSFVTKMSSIGEIQWIKMSYGGTAGNFPSSITINHQGDAYVLGNFLGTSTFGSVTLNYPIFGNGFDLYFWKIPKY